MCSTGLVLPLLWRKDLVCIGGREALSLEFMYADLSLTVLRHHSSAGQTSGCGSESGGLFSLAIVLLLLHWAGLSRLILMTLM